MLDDPREKTSALHIFTRIEEMNPYDLFVIQIFSQEEEELLVTVPESYFIGECDGVSVP